MPIILRQPNDPYPITVILGILAQAIHQYPQGTYNTYLAQISTSGTGSDLTFVQAKYKMSLAMTAAQPYAVHLSGGSQRFNYNGGPRNRSGQAKALIELCARWDDQSSSIDAIRNVLQAELERYKANLEQNDDLVFNGQAYVWSMPNITISDYKGMFDTQFTGLTLVQQQMAIDIYKLPYDA